MNTQIDLFATGEARSYPPHLDPEKVSGVQSRTDVDRDHVGTEAIGRYGNNQAVTVVEALGHDGAILHAETFADPASAQATIDEWQRKLFANRQRELFA